MPNWCGSILKIVGTKDEIASIAETQLDFEKILPTPADLIPETHGDYVMTEQQEQENIQKYGHKDWYGWCVDNWGTKWTASNKELHITNSKTIYAKMITAWGLPMKILQKISKEHPNTTIQIIDCMEESGAFTGNATIKKGEVIKCNIYKPTREEFVEQRRVWERRNKKKLSEYFNTLTTNTQT